MKKPANIFTAAALAVLLPLSAAHADPSAFPSSGLDAQSLGRGGTVIAARAGIWSSFGNPATLTPDGLRAIGVEYLDQKDAEESTWGLTVLDTSSGIRGALSYYMDPHFSEFTNKLWGVSFAQDLARSLILGESYHRGDYEPGASPGTEKSLSTFDVGLLYKLGPRVSIGYVVHNLLPSDRDLLDRYSGVGVGIQLPMTLYLAADYEEDPVLTSESTLRAGVEFSPVGKITGRLGYQDHADGTSYLTMGITYMDVNGTLDAGILYNEDTDRTDRVAFGISIRM